MAEDKIVGDAPDYKGDGIAIWEKKDRNGKTYMSCCILGKINIPAWKNDKK